MVVYRWAILVRGDFVWLNGIIIRVLRVRVPYFKLIKYFIRSCQTILSSHSFFTLIPYPSS